MGFSLDGRTILITGASTGIGAEMAKQLGDRAGRLILVARSEDKLRELAANLSCETRAIPLDLTAEGAVDELVRRVEDWEVDVLINNAGVGQAGRFVHSDEERLLRVIQLNVTALTQLTRRLVPGMVARRRGALLHVGSTAGFQGCPFMATYGATKAFVRAFNEALAWELRGTGVTSTLLAPGTTDTPFFDSGGFSPERLGKAESPAKVARVGLRALERGKLARISGFLNALGVHAQRFLTRGGVGMATYHVLRALDDGEKKP